MKRLISSKDNSNEPRGTIGKQKCGIIFWQKTSLLRHCNMLVFQSIISLIDKKFSPTNVQNHGESCFIQFDNNVEKTIYLSIKKQSQSNHYFIYGEAHTIYVDSNFHIFALNIIDYIANELLYNFFVDDATGYLEHRSVEMLKEYIEKFNNK